MSVDTLLALAKAPEVGEAGLDKPGKMIFLGLRPPTMPENRFMTYVTIATILELASLPDRVAVLFSDSPEQLELARVIGQHSKAVGVFAIHLDGIPGATESVAFRDAVFGLDTVSHSVFISEMALELEVEAQRNAAKPARRIDKEVAQVRRANGDIKEADIGIADESIDSGD